MTCLRAGHLLKLCSDVELEVILTRFAAPAISVRPEYYDWESPLLILYGYDEFCIDHYDYVKHTPY